MKPISVSRGSCVKCSELPPSGVTRVGIVWVGRLEDGRVWGGEVELPRPLRLRSRQKEATLGR